VRFVREFNERSQVSTTDIYGLVKGGAVANLGYYVNCVPAEVATLSSSEAPA
jgi:hypothetical protein